MNGLNKIANFQNLYNAHLLCRRGKRKQDSMIRFEMNLSSELIRLEKELKDYSYRLGGYHTFKVYDPKERNIQALSYRDRIVQHALCDYVLGPALEPRLIYDNSACRKGKGTHFSMNRLSEFMYKHFRQYGTDGYILKFDIHKYFDSISHAVLLEELDKIFSDDREIRGLLHMIVNSYEHKPGRGIPMGNQSSQWFGIYYLNGMDHYIKEKLHIKYYTRYMDDGIIIHNDREYLKQCLEQMREYIEKKLQLEFNEKTQIIPLSQGVDYLGFHFYLNDTGKVVKKLRTSAKKRLKRKIKNFKGAYRKGKLSSKEIGRSLISYRGHLSHGNTHALWHNTINNLVLTRSNVKDALAEQQFENKYVVQEEEEQHEKQTDKI